MAGKDVALPGIGMTSLWSFHGIHSLSGTVPFLKNMEGTQMLVLLHTEMLSISYYQFVPRLSPRNQFFFKKFSLIVQGICIVKIS
jgi:dihydroorotase